MMILYKNTQPFEKDFKRLKKKYPTLSEDLAVAKKNAIELYHTHNIDNQSIKLIQRYQTETIQVFKLRKFACKSLKGKGCFSGIRVMYAYTKEKQLIEFLEIYYKGNKSNPDQDRLKKFIKKH